MFRRILFCVLLLVETAHGQNLLCRFVNRMIGGPSGVLVPQMEVGRAKTLDEAFRFMDVMMRGGSAAQKLIPGKLPDAESEPHRYEWAVAYDPQKKDYVLIFGDRTRGKETERGVEILWGNIDPARFPDLQLVAHSHSPPNADRTTPLSFAKCKEVYGPSGNDIAHFAKNNLREHTIFTPMIQQADGEYGLAPAGSKASLVRFEVKNSRVFGILKPPGPQDFQGGAVESLDRRTAYVAEVEMKIGDKVLWKGSIATVYVGSQRFTIPFNDQEKEGKETLKGTFAWETLPSELK